MRGILGGIFTFLLFFTAISESLQGQNVYEIYVNCYAKSRELKDVQFTLMQNDQIVIEQTSKNGTFHFIIMENEGHYILKATRDGYIPKAIHFKSLEYPFSNEYEIQEIDIAFDPLEEGQEQIQRGELKWSNVTESFSIIKIDEETQNSGEKEILSNENALNSIYDLSIENGDDLLEKKEADGAIKSFEIALLAKPNDEHAKKKLIEARILKVDDIDPPKVDELKVERKVFASEEVMEKINSGNIEDIPVENLDPSAIYMVQLGAFSGKIDLNKFSAVPDFKTIEYEDFTRCFSGEFSDPNLAIARKAEMVSGGFKDAWIVVVKGNKRVGF